MAEISNDDMNTAFVEFCRLLEIDSNSQFSVFEFTSFIKMKSSEIVTECFKEPNGPCKISDKTLRNVELIFSPHVETILKIYAIRKNTWLGRLRARVLKYYHVTIFYISNVIELIVAIWRHFIWRYFT